MISDKTVNFNFENDKDIDSKSILKQVYEALAEKQL